MSDGRLVLAESTIGFTADGEIVTGRKLRWGNGKGVIWQVSIKERLSRNFVQKGAAIEYASALIDGFKTAELSRDVGKLDKIHFLRHHSPRGHRIPKFRNAS
jgi:hypothetical protein